MISFKHMEYFIEVAKSKQISKASENLEVSQSTITMAMKTIENKINASLLIRTQKGIELTYEGFIFLEHAKRIVSSAKEMMTISSQNILFTKGSITIALSFTISGYYFANYYAEFTKKFPNIKVTLIESSRAEIEEGLASGKYDIGLFNVSKLENKSELSYETIFKSKRSLWVSSSHDFLHRKSISLKDISKESCILITVDEADKISQSYWKEHSLIPNIIYKTKSIEAVRSMVASGTGISILSDLVYRPWSLEGKRIEKLDIKENVPSLDVGIAWSINKERSEIVNIFLTFMNVSTNK